MESVVTRKPTHETAESTVKEAVKPAIVQADIFPVPVFQVPVPGMRRYHDELLGLFSEQIRSGQMKAHANGYGYQTKINLFDQKVFPQRYLRDVLLTTFRQACAQILAGTITDFAPGLPTQWINTFNIGWASIQTSEVWPDEIPWHTHMPAVLSGCYYVSTAKKQGEGVLQFMNPNAPSIFQPRVGEIAPKEGHILIFPSQLNHRPTATPGNGDDIRLALCMDGHWTSRIGHAE